MTRLFKKFVQKRDNHINLDELIYKRAPHHPGIVLKDIIMKGLNISNEELSRKSRISIDDVNKLAAGTIPFTEDFGEKLNQVIGSWVTPLIELQKEFDYYSANGSRTISHEHNADESRKLNRSFSLRAHGAPALRNNFGVFSNRTKNGKRLGEVRARYSIMKNDKDS